MNVTVIANPGAGRGKANREIERLAQVLQAQGYHVDVHRTRIAVEGARPWSITAGCTAIVIAGGDGTVNEVLNGIADPSQIPIAILPVGTANLLARELRLPKNPEDVAALLDRGAVRKIDMGVIGDRRFLLVVSAGFDAMVTEAIQRSRRGPLGYRGYFLPLLRILTRYHPPELEVTVDGQKATKGAFVVASNVKNYGGIFKVADKAECDSGHLDVCIFRHGTVRALLRYAFAGLRGRVSSLPDVVYLTGRQIRIDARQSVAVEVDGDYFGTTPVMIELKPACVPILVADR